MRPVSAHKGVDAIPSPMVSTMMRKRIPNSSQRVPVRKRPRSVIERYVTAFGMTLGIGTAVAGLGYWGFSTGWMSYLTAALEAHVVTATAHAGYTLTTLEVEGRTETSKQDVMLALGAMKGDPILDVDLEAARQRIVELPWVMSAIVERRLPGTLRVTLTEAEPLALWQKKGGFYLVSHIGEVIPVKDVARFNKLPVLVGEGAPQKAGELFAMLALEPALKQRVAAAVFVGNRRWNLRINNGIDIKLPELAPAAAWQKFAVFERQYHLLEKDISIIDLRQSDKLVVRQAHPVMLDSAENEGGTKSTKTKPAEKPGLTPEVMPVSAPGAKNDAT